MEDKQFGLRKSKLKDLREMGIAPCANGFALEHTDREPLSIHASKSPEKLEQMEDIFSLAGRIVSKRNFGKNTFFYLSDRTERIQ